MQNAPPRGATRLHKEQITLEKQITQLSLPQQGEHNARQDPLNSPIKQQNKTCKTPRHEEPQGYTKNK